MLEAYSRRVIEESVRPLIVVAQCFTCGETQEAALSGSAEGVRVVHPILAGGIHEIKWLPVRMGSHVTTAE